MKSAKKEKIFFKNKIKKSKNNFKIETQWKLSEIF